MYFFLCYFYALILFTLVYCILTVRRNSPLPYRLLTWWMIATVPTECTAIVVGHFYHRNHWVYNIWGPIECCMLLLVFYKGVIHRKTKRLCLGLLVLLPFGVFITYLPHFIFFTLNVHEMLFCLFSELIAACIFLTDGLLDGEEFSIFRRPLSWMGFGTILYCCSFILTHALWDYLLAWPKWRYGVLVFIANTFQYGGVILTFAAFRRNERQGQRITIL